MQKTLILDIDDSCILCADPLQAFIERAIHQTAISPLRDHLEISRSFNVTEAQADQLVEDFWYSKEFANLPADPSAKIVLPNLHREGYSLIGITACGSDPQIIQSRHSNLLEVFGFNFKAIHCVGLRGDKSIVLRSYPPSIWVEDHWLNAMRGHEAGHRTFLLDRPYNQLGTWTGIRRVQNWHDIQRIISEESG